MVDTFFDGLQKHSEAKLRILEQYVIPWMRKVVLGHQKYYGDEYNKCFIIDGFAGQGKYDNGKDGSPLILLKSAMEFCDQARDHGWKAPEIYILYIEGFKENYFKLRDNLKDFAGLELSDKGFTQVPSYPSIKVSCINDQFQNAITQILDQVQRLIPTFCFVDPFGFKDTPLDLLARLMNSGKSEILMNLIYEETNRFITVRNPKVQEHLCSLFGTDQLTELTELVEGRDPSERKKAIVDYYSNQLKIKAGAEYVLDFEIKKDGRTKLILFHGTKNIEGLRLMKTVMWKIGETGYNVFDARKQRDQMDFGFGDITDEERVADLSNLIYDNFKSQKKVTIDRVEEFVLLKTKYPVENYTRKALKTLEADGRIIEVKKINGSKRKSGFKDVYIHFK